jgi:hypothetical protein
MPILTKSQKLKLKDKEILTPTMAEEDPFNVLCQKDREDPFNVLHQKDEEEPTNNDIEDAQQDPKFHKFIEEILEKDT